MIKAGEKVYSSNGKEEAKVTGYVHRSCPCGQIGRVRVKWSDGKITLLCPKGIQSFKDGYKIS